MVFDGGNFQIQTRTDANVFVAAPFALSRSGVATFTSGVTASSFSGVGSSLTALNATQLTSGTAPAARLGSGTASTNTLLRGDSQWVTPGRIFVASTENTSSTKQNQWAKLATVTLTAQYADVDLGLTIRGNGTGSTATAHARLAVRVKQQNALGGVPIYSLVADGLVTLSLDRFALVITQNDGSATVGELWIKAPRQFELYYAYEHTQLGTNYTVAYVTNSVFQVSLPSAVNGNAIIIADSFPLVLSNAGTGDFGVTLSYGGTLTADRQINIAVGDRTSNWSLNGDLTLASNFTTSGTNSLTLTTTGSTNVTLPTSGTLATTDNIPDLTTAASPPSNPIAGDRWLNTTDGVEYTYVDDGNSSQWVDLGRSSAVTVNSSVPIYFSETQPVDTSQFIWIQTGLGADGNGISLWINT